MTTDTDLQRQVTSVFADAAPSGYPDELLARVLSTTSRTRSRPAWLAYIKEPPMRIPSRVVVGSPTLRLAAILALTLALTLAAAGVVVAGASLLPTQPLPPPYGPARNGSLVYAKDGDIYLSDADGSDPRPIITGDTIDNYPWFSQDGTHIAFGRGPDSDLAGMVANADGTNVVELMPAIMWAEFTPSGDQLVATRTVGSQLVLSIADLAGSEPIRNLDIGDIELRDWVMPRPTNGDEIIFTGRPNPGKKDLGIFAIKPDGTGLRTVGAISTTESGDDAGTRPNPQQISFQDPVLSPDGSTIAYWSWEPGKGGEAPDAHMHLRDLTTGEELPVLFDQMGASNPKGDDNGLLVHYSPDGTMVVFEGCSSTTSMLCYGPVDGSEPSRPIGPAFSYTSRQGFDFSPDGKQVILSLIGKIQAIDVVTGETTKLTNIPNVPGWQRLAP